MIDEKYHEALVRADKEFVTKRTELEKAKNAFLKAKKELDEWQDLNKEMVVKVKKRHFTVTWFCRERIWGREETLYMTPNEWLNAKKEEAKYGTGYILEKVNDW